MIRKKCALLVAVLIFALTSGVSLFAQAQEEGQTTTNTTSQAGAQAIINNGRSAGRQFPGAVPGVVGQAGPFPGFPIDGGQWQLYRPLTYRKLSMDEVNTMKFRGGFWRFDFKKRVRSVRLTQSLGANDNPIELIAWWPKSGGYENDRILGVITIIGDPWWPEEAYLGLGLAEAKKITGTNRVAIRVRNIREGVTKGRSIGGGGSVARIAQPGTENDGVAFATGGLLGTNRVRMEDYVEFEILCLNNGPTALPQPPPPPPPSPDEQSEAVPRAQQPRPAQQPVYPPLADKARIEGIARMPPAEEEVAPSRPAPLPTTRAATSMEYCQLPEFTVYFPYNQYNIVSEYRAKIRDFAVWLRQHGQCILQVEGHASNTGTSDYNAVLARNRARVVYEALIADGVSREQILQFVSVSKDRLADDRPPGDPSPTAEFKPTNRRVIIRVIGPASGK